MALLLVDLMVGGGGMSWASGAVLWKLRVPRVMTALLAGGALALSGAQMQAVFRNPLADPHIMGVSGGAGLGAAIATMALGVSSSYFTGFTVALAAFLGAFVAAALVVAVSTRFRSTTTLLVFGVMLGFIFSALSSVLQYTAGEESLKLFYSWMAGSFSGSRYMEVILMAGALALGLVLSIVNGKGLDLILFGEEYATLSGASTRRILILSMLSACLMTGTVTAFCGPLGFVGIVAPHIARRITGSSAHQQVLPWSLATGATLALAADILANLWPIPLPVGSTLALIGIPLVLILLLRNQSSNAKY
ncbi:MAG: iron ABC transporter permease [Bacteroidales bacterium]|nr:iron ABC transporter permease [Bacteroidales bacterium]